MPLDGGSGFKALVPYKYMNCTFLVRHNEDYIISSFLFQLFLFSFPAFGRLRARGWLHKNIAVNHPRQVVVAPREISPILAVSIAISCCTTSHPLVYNC
jgi:Zn-dependent protease